MANPETPRSEPANGSRTVTRREVLAGMAGVAGLVSIPSIIAACGGTPAATTARPSATPAASVPSATATAAASSAPPAGGGEVTFGSNYSDAIPKAAMQAAADSFTKKTGIAVKINTVDHGAFQDNIS